MVVVTTLSYDELAVLIKENQVALNNENLLFGDRYDAIRNYIEEHLGGEGYVVAIRGYLNPASVKLLSTLDRGLQGNKVIIEADVNKDDLLVFDVEGLDKAVEAIRYGLPDDVVTETLDEAQASLRDDVIQVVCTPHIKKSGNIRVTSLNRNIDFNVSGITFVRMNGGG